MLHLLVATLIVLALPAVPGRAADDDPVPAPAIHVVLPPRLVFLPNGPPRGGGGGAKMRGPTSNGKYLGSSSLSMYGSFSRRAASRSHIAVFVSTGPIERYSAMPSINQRGSWLAPLWPGAAFGFVVMSN